MQEFYSAEHHASRKARQASSRKAHSLSLDGESSHLLDAIAERSDGVDPLTLSPIALPPTTLLDEWKLWRLTKRIILSPYSGHAATVLVVVNLILMCLPYEGMPKGYGRMLDVLDEGS